MGFRFWGRRFAVKQVLVYFGVTLSGLGMNGLINVLGWGSGFKV